MLIYMVGVRGAQSLALAGPNIRFADPDTYLI